MTNVIAKATHLRLCGGAAGIEHDRKPIARYKSLRWARVSQFFGFTVFVDFDDGSSQPLVLVCTDGAEDAVIYPTPNGGYVVPTRNVILNVQNCIRDLLESHMLTKQIVVLGESGLMACYSPFPIRVKGYNHGNP
jgi:hypothetical protein